MTNHYSHCSYVNDQAKCNETRPALQISVTVITFDRNGGGCRRKLRFHKKPQHTIIRS